jgi:hypothetical protein
VTGGETFTLTAPREANNGQNGRQPVASNQEEKETINFDAARNVLLAVYAGANTELTPEDDEVTEWHHALTGFTPNEVAMVLPSFLRQWEGTWPDPEHLVDLLTNGLVAA